MLNFVVEGHFQRHAWSNFFAFMFLPLLLEFSVLLSVTTSSSTGAINTRSAVESGVPTDGDTQQYWERLKILRQRCGLDNTSEKGSTEEISAPNKTISALNQQALKAADSSSSLSSNSSGGLVSLASNHFLSLI